MYRYIIEFEKLLIVFFFFLVGVECFFFFKSINIVIIIIIRISIIGIMKGVNDLKKKIIKIINLKCYFKKKLNCFLKIFNIIVLKFRIMM